MKIISGPNKTTINHIETNKKEVAKTKDTVATKTKAQANIYENAALKKEDLLVLAKDLKEGTISGDEAKDRFVETIVKNRLHGKLSDKDVAAINEAVKQVCGDDMNFTKDLAKNLRSLT